MADEDFPITKSDVHYNAETQEVTLPREKYDALINYVRGLVEQVSAADDERDIAEYRARRATTSESVLQEMLGDVADLATKSVSHWLESHSIRQLSERSGIPYATCHRIVNERLGTSRIEVETLGKLARAIKSPELDTRQEGLPRQETTEFCEDEAFRLPEVLRHTVEGLPADLRTVFVLRDVEGFSTEETAAALKLTVQAVRSRLLVARQQAQKRLKGYFQKLGSGGSEQRQRGNPNRAKPKPIGPVVPTFTEFEQVVREYKLSLDQYLRLRDWTRGSKLYDDDTQKLVNELRRKESTNASWDQRSQKAEE